MKSVNYPLKVIDKTEETLTVEGYIAIFGDEAHKDLDGEYFHAGTQFDSGYTKVNGLVVDWEHGQSPDMGDDGEELDQPGRHDPLGMLDYTTARNDGVGLLARAVLNRREWYVRELVEPLAMAGLLGGSSEAIPGKVVKSGGRIDVWPLMRYALTVTPADPRQITEHQIQLVKSLANRYPALKALTEVGKTEPISVTSQWTGTTIPEFTTTTGTSGNTTNYTLVIPAGYVAPSSVKQQDIPADEPQTTTGDSTPDPVTTQEDVQPQAASAPATVASEAEADKDELTPRQIEQIAQAVSGLLNQIQETI